MADLREPSAAEVAKHLGVSVRTVYAWNAAESAPRAAVLALFWESSYGRSAIDCDLVNTARVHKNLSESLGHENENLRARIARLERIGGFGSANDPILAVR